MLAGNDFWYSYQNVSMRLKCTKFLLLAFLFSSFMMTSCGSSRKTIAVEEGWELLDDRKVNFVRDKDVIEVQSRTPFSTIQFKVEDRDIHINGVKIYFDNGDKLEPAIDDIIPANQSSRLIELSPEGRYVTRIEFKYRTTGSVLKGRAHVLTFGRRAGYYPR
jgi:hypothetical protein